MRTTIWFSFIWGVCCLSVVIAGAPVPGQVDPIQPGFREGNVNPAGVVLAWTSDPKATSYRVQFTESPDGSHDFSNPLIDEVVTDTTLSLPDLAYGDVYIWHVRGIDETGAGPWSIVTGFITVRGGPLQVQLVSPEEAEQDVAVAPTDLVWQPVDGADSYFLEVSTVVDFSTAVVSVPEVRDTRYLTSALQREVLYYWRVKASNAARANWSWTRQFYTGRLVPAQVALAAPPDGATQQPADLSFAWQPRAGVFTYTLQVARDAGFTDVLLTQEALTEPTHKVAGLDFATTYYWRVRGENDKGIGPWSAVWQLTTLLPLPAQVTLASPIAEALDQPLDVTFAWHAVPDQATYTLHVTQDSTFADEGTAVVGLADTTYQAVDLAENTRYFWRVRAENAAGPGAWSTVRAFQTALQPPGAGVALAVPADAAADVMFPIQLGWHSLVGAAAYTVQVARDRRFTDLVQHQIGLADTTLAAEVDPAQLYYWRVRGENTAGAGPWSVVWRFMSITTVGTEAVEEAGQPGTFDLAHNYPNPFSAATHLSWSLPEAEQVRLTVYDLHGREVAVLADGPMAAGQHVVTWAPADLPSGVYFYHITAGPYGAVRPMMRLP